MPFSGFIAAPFTPFLPDGKINKSLIPAYRQYLKSNGLRGAFINGTTGEGLSLSEKERMELTEAWMKDKAADFVVMVSVGANSLVSAQDMAAHAQSAGVDAIAMIAPGFFKPQKVEDLVALCQLVAAQAPQTDFYYYHIPVLTGIDLPMHSFMQIATRRIPNFRGLKYSSTNFMDLHKCIEDFEQGYEFLFGVDEQLLYGLLAGVTGAVGSTYNYMCPLYQQIVSAFQQNDFVKARRLQSQTIHFVDALIRNGGGVAGGKALMSHISGLDLGPCRLPLNSISATDVQKWLKQREMKIFSMG